MQLKVDLSLNMNLSYKLISHFEAMTELDYSYSCVTCGHYPSVVIMDLHKKGAFGMPRMYTV